ERSSSARLQAPRLKFTNAFGALYDLLLALGRIPAENSDVGTRALAVANSLFPEGAMFTRLDAVESWTHGSRLIRRIEDESLEREIDSLGGPAIMSTIRSATHELGEAIGVSKEPVAIIPSTALVDSVVAFQSAVAAYVRVLAADVDEEDDTSVARF